MIEKYIQASRKYALSHEPNFGDGESVLTMLYECHNEKMDKSSTQFGNSAGS